MLILAAACLLRILYLFDFASLPLFGQVTGPDVSEYFSEAQKIRAGRWLPDRSSIHAPLYPFVLASILFAAGGDLFWGRLIHVLLFGLLTLGPVYFILRKRTAGLSGTLCFLPETATLLLGIYPPLIICQCDFFSENLMLVMLLLSLSCFFLHWKYADGLAGVFCGFALLAHPGCIFYLPLASLYAVMRLYRAKRPNAGKKAVLRGVSLLIGALLVIGPVCLRNSLSAGRLVMVQENSMFNLVLGNSPDSTGTCRIPPGMRWEKEFESAAGQAAEQGVSLDSYYRDRFFRYLFSQPGHYVRMLMKKAAMALSCREFTTWSDATSLQLIFWHRYLYQNWFLLLLMLGGPALFLGFFSKNIRRLFGPELLLFTAVWAGQIFFVTAGRYRMPLVVPLAVFGAYFLCRIRYYLGTPRRFFSCLILMAALFLTASYPHAVPRQPEIDYARSLLASAYIQAGDPNAAVEIYQAPAAGECFPERRLTVLGQAHYSLGDRKRAGDFYREFIRLYPKQPHGYLNYGSILSDSGRFAEAEKYLNAALLLHPKGKVMADLEYNLGQIAQRTRRPDQAEKHYRAALSVLPAHSKALNNLGSIYIGRRKPEQALPLFEKALLLEPENSGVKVNIALCLAMSGRKQEASVMVSDILRRDPKFVPAQRLRQSLEQR